MRKSRLLASIALGLLVAGLAVPAAFAGHRRPRVSIRIYGGPVWGYPYYPFHHIYHFHPYVPYYPYAYEPPDYAVVDTDVAPEEARVFLNGEEIGEADDFDGFPDYLEVSPGRHVLEFRHEGFRTLRINLSAERGRLYRIKRKLQRGTSEDSVVADIGSPPSRRRDEQDRQVRPPAEGSVPGRGEGRQRQQAASEATLHFRLRPGDSTVYLDGQFLGAGESLAGEAGVRVSPGRHTVEVLRPGYAPQRLRIDLSEGESRTVTVRLERLEQSEPTL